MVYQGHVENGTVVLDNPATLPDGTRVEIAVIEEREGEDVSYPVPSLYDRLKSVVGMAKGLPPDLALNHDHYLHGQPKR
jgi:hypothetical protein